MEWLLAAALAAAFLAGLLLGRRAKPDALREVVLDQCLVVGPTGATVDYHGGESPFVVTRVGLPPTFHKTVDDAVADFRRAGRV